MVLILHLCSHLKRGGRCGSSREQKPPSLTVVYENEDWIQCCCRHRVSDLVAYASEVLSKLIAFLMSKSVSILPEGRQCPQTAVRLSYLPVDYQQAFDFVDVYLLWTVIARNG